ncbi:hypothetical protein [Microbulbifer variabilis]|uniref:hypothetical protein n=1 Tax=Microbulbifer variabilis TaxID=266805 RepID=UPI001CFCDF47|nr:hypothetical protein [Microbulbifer variabilis]
MICPFSEFSFQVSLVSKDNSIHHINRIIDDHPVKINLPEKYIAIGILLSILEITHSPIYALNAEADGTIGIGPAYFTIGYRYYSAEHCDAEIDEILILMSGEYTSFWRSKLFSRVTGSCRTAKNWGGILGLRPLPTSYR